MLLLDLMEALPPLLLEEGPLQCPALRSLWREFVESAANPHAVLQVLTAAHPLLPVSHHSSQSVSDAAHSPARSLPLPTDLPLSFACLSGVPGSIPPGPADPGALGDGQVAASLVALALVERIHGHALRHAPVRGSSPLLAPEGAGRTHQEGCRRRQGCRGLRCRIVEGV